MEHRIDVVHKEDSDIDTSLHPYIKPHRAGTDIGLLRGGIHVDT